MRKLTRICYKHLINSLPIAGEWKEIEGAFIPSDVAIFLRMTKELIDKVQSIQEFGCSMHLLQDANFFIQCPPEEPYGGLFYEILGVSISIII